MMRRVAALLGSALKDVWGGTFHAVAARLLRIHARDIGMGLLGSMAGVIVLSPAAFGPDSSTRKLPQLSGLDILQAWREQGVGTPVIMMTAYGDVDTAVAAMRAGAYDFIPKPLDPKHLEVVINKALERESLREAHRKISPVMEEGGEELLPGI